MSEPIQCPFCGGNATTISDECGCPDCDIWLPIEEWNRRAAIEYEDFFYLPKPEYALFGHQAEDMRFFPDECKVTFKDRFDISIGAVLRYRQDKLSTEIVRRMVEVFRTECRRTEDGNCSECGRHLGRDAAFCKHCGARVTHSGQ